MDHRHITMELRILGSFLIHTTLLCCMNFFFLSQSATTFGNETDGIALLAFKEGITSDPFGALSSWNNSLHFCQWRGVTCSRRHRRVTILDLRSQRLVGSISPSIGNLSFLRGINLRYNDFHGEIPQEIGRLFRLQHLNLTQNSLQGDIPINLTHCSELRFLDLFVNKIQGRIPVKLGTLSKLVGLVLANNYLTGTIPPSLSNLSSLTSLSLSENNLSGNIPSELGQLSRLEFFQVSANKLLTGTIPTQLFNISSMVYFAVAENQFSGNIPPYIGLTLPYLQVLLLGSNRFTGPIPDSIANASGLLRLDFPINEFTGSIPANLGRLQGLTKLNFGLNRLGTGKADDLSFLTSLANCSHLEILALSINNLSGELPLSVANLSSQLKYLYIGGNQISGKIPAGIENLVSLISLGMENNLLTGTIPVSIGKLLKLEILSLFGNRFSGHIPSSIGNTTLLTEINFQGNDLEGSIPSSLGNCRYLKILDLSGNNLTGTIPKEVIGLSSLSIYLDLAQNSFTGTLPLEVGNLESLRELDLSDNQFSGKIPNTIGNCLNLEHIYLKGNFFQGSIPQSLSSLRGIQDIDLSHNNLSGQIPEYLGTFVYLENLNLSFNDLEGEIPKDGIFKNASAISVLGNNKVCGGVPELHLPACPTPGSTKQRRHLSLKIVLFLIIGGVFCLILICFLAALHWRRKARKKSSSTPQLEDKYPKVSYAELLKATDEFSSANLIGVGSYGSVYRGTLGHDQTVVAVKVLDLQRQGASKSFMAECEALRYVRHRNLVKILTSCSSVDHKGNDFKALVFEFMPNGSLEKWLHPEADEQHETRYLNLMQRLNVAIDVAHALDYLHRQCHSPIIHCDLKPSNVLLDDDMNAHVGDFGLARFLFDNTSQNHTSSVGIKGSVGYVAPEYGVGAEVSTYGDVYSFGILLLEMLTRRRPTDDMFEDGVSLHNFAKMGSAQVMEIVDPILLDVAEHDEGLDDSSKLQESLYSMVKIGILCSTELARERMGMRDVITGLQAIRDELSRVGVHGEGTMIR